MTDQINLGLVWADTGGATAVSVAKYEGGWVAEIPTYQNFNYMVQGLDQNILHFVESDSYNWQTDINYKAGARVVSPLGIMFTARAAGIGVDPDTDPGNSSWVHGWLLGSNFTNLLESDGLKVELPERANSNFTGVDQVIVNRNPMIELRTISATNNWALGNVAGELVAHNLGQAGADARSLVLDGTDTFRIFHEGHHALVSEVVGAIPDSLLDGQTYGRNNGNWIPVSSTTVSIAPPPAVSGGGQGWYNLDDGQFYVDINDGDSSQWVPANPPLIPELADSIRSTLGSATRNSVLTPDVFGGVSSPENGFSATIYQGNNEVAQAINTGLDMFSGDFGGLIWVKKRAGGVDRSHGLIDSVRGDDALLSSNLTDAEFTSIGSYINNFSSTGFSVGTSLVVNEDSDTYTAWSWQTTEKVEPTYAASIIVGDDSTFATIGNWTPHNNASLSVAGGQLTIVDASPWDSGAELIITTVAGKAYEVIYNTTGPREAFVEVLGLVSNGNPYTGTRVGIFTLSFIATSTTSVLQIRTGSGLTQSDVIVDDILCREITSGTTSRGKPYTCHYNPDMAFSIVSYEGDGLEGHEIPHHLSVEPELSITKNRDEALDWLVQGTAIGSGTEGNFMRLSTTQALATALTAPYHVDNNIFSIGENNQINDDVSRYISYHFASVSGVCKIGKYIGTGVQGNYVSTEVDGGDMFKPAFVLVKSLTTANSWIIEDTTRGDEWLYPDSSIGGAATNELFILEEGGFQLNSGSSVTNVLNEEYMFMAFAESSTGGAGSNTYTNTSYNRSTNGNQITVKNGTVISHANGFDENGEVNFNETVVGDTLIVLPVDTENKKLWIYKDQGGSFGTTEFRPLEGIVRNDADKYGVASPSDSSLRTTHRHFDYESASGIASSSSENIAGNTWQALDKLDWATTWLTLSGNTTGWWKYKQTEKRILKSYRFMSPNFTSNAATNLTIFPKDWTIEGSDDGFNWDVIETVVGYTSTGDGSRYIWEPLRSTSGNTTAYLHHRINITLNNGHALYVGFGEMEFNTILPSDYYLVAEGVMYNSSSTPILRTYIGTVETDSNGDIVRFNEESVAKLKGVNAEIHEDLIVHGVISNRGIATAWVNFDGTKNPPLIRDSLNVADVVDNGAGIYTILFNDPLELGYSVSMSSSLRSDTANAVSEGIYSNSNWVSAERSMAKNSLKVLSRGTSDVDRDVINVHIFGGREIK